MKIKQKNIKHVNSDNLSKEQKIQIRENISAGSEQRQKEEFQSQFGTLVSVLNKIIKKTNKRDGVKSEPIENYGDLKTYLHMHQNSLEADVQLLGRLAIRDKKRLKHKMKNLENTMESYEEAIAAIINDETKELAKFEYDPYSYLVKTIVAKLNFINQPGKVKLNDINSNIDEFVKILGQLTDDTIDQAMLDGLKDYHKKNESSLLFLFDESSMEYIIRNKLKDVLESEIRRLDKSASIVDAFNVDVVEEVAEEVVVEDDVEHVIESLNDESASELKNDSESELVAKSLSEMTSDVASEEAPEVASVRENRVHGLAIVFSQPKAFEITRKDSLKNIERSEDFQNLRKRWANKS